MLVIVAATVAASLADHLKAKVGLIPLKEGMMKGTRVRPSSNLTESPVRLTCGNKEISS